VVYPQGDPVARALAERMVALAGTSPRLRTMGLEPAALEASLQSGTEQAYIWAVPRQTLDPCRELSGLVRGMRVQPLIDTRARAIVRRGAPPLEIDWDGTVRVPDQ
jgi:hypothetical protein